MTKLRLKAFVFPLFKILYSRYEHDRTKLTTVAVFMAFFYGLLAVKEVELCVFAPLISWQDVVNCVAAVQRQSVLSFNEHS